MTKYSPRTVLAREGVAVKEAQTMRENLFDHAATPRKTMKPY